MQNANNDDPKRLHQVLTHNALSCVVNHAHDLIALMPVLQARFPREMSGMYALMNIRGDTLVLATANAAIATKIKYMEYELLAALDGQSCFLGIKHIIAKVKPDLFTLTKTPANKKQRLSSYAAELLQQTANEVSSAELANALKKLSKHIE